MVLWREPAEAGARGPRTPLSDCKKVNVANKSFLAYNVLVASEGEIKQRFSSLEAWLDERSRRLWAAAESAAHGRGGISLVARASGVSRRAIAVGLAELKKKPDPSLRKRLPIRQKGGGRKKTSLKDPALLLDLERLLEPVTRGDPQSPLRWTCRSVRNLADELQARGHKVSHVLVAELLHEQKYSLQANRKTKEGYSHPDRNAQFEYINAKATEFPSALAKSCPVVLC